MFIELTDHLRCPADHHESFLVLIPDRMQGREVERGMLGCPVCQREYPIVGGVVRFTSDLPLPDSVPSEGPVNAHAIAAFLGLEGPGGYVGLVGTAAAFASALEPIWPGIHLVAVNPPPGVEQSPSLSVLVSPSLPFKTRSLRGIVLGRPYGASQTWPETAVGAVLPGLRAAGQGLVPEVEGFELMGQADDWWVGRTR